MNLEALQALIAHYRDDPDALDMIMTLLDDFEKYHSAVYDEQMLLIVYGGTMDGETYREQMQALDRSRTVAHNAVISGVKILNRMAKKANLPPVYDGIVSEARPYRREVANAVFAYIEDVIRNRTPKEPETDKEKEEKKEET